MNTTLASCATRYGSLMIVLVAVGTPAPAGVITTGDVSPGGAGTHQDPWFLRDDLYVGKLGRFGSLSITVGGQVVNTTGHIGYGTNSTGVATVTGSDSQWNNSENLYVGNEGAGTLNVRYGGVVSNADGHIGYEADSTGVATVTGANAQWNNSDDLWIGGNGSAAGGAGTLNLYDSGLATVAGTTKLWETGTVYLDGGKLTTGSFDNSDGGNFNFHDGTLTVNGAGGVFNPGVDDFSINGNAADDASHLVIANTATTTLERNLAVGKTRAGFLSVESGGVVTNRNGYIGDDSGATGEATVTGPGSEWNNAYFLHVGSSGDGTLNVTDGGVVANYYGYIGDRHTSTGKATVTGANSQWNNLSDLYVGSFGDGTLNVEAGGLVANTSGYIGRYFFNSTGKAKVTGAGSLWDNSANLYVGHEGNGTLNVEAAGVVTDTDGYIGWRSDSTGEATVTGAGSLWDNSANLYVGRYGSGTLNVESAGVVTDTDGYIGWQSGSTGEATVTGAGSLWDNSANLYVGHEGNGTLNVEAGGVVTSTNGFIGGNHSGIGEAMVTGRGSQWNNLRHLHVGLTGTGTLNITDGGVVSNTGFGYIGGNSGSTGTATVTGSGSQWNSSDNLYISAAGGLGTLNLDDSGLATVSDTTKLWPTGTINLDGGSLTTGSFDNSQAGTLNFHDGTLTVNGVGGMFDPGVADFTIDGLAPTDLPALVITNTASATLSGDLTVGSSKQGQLTVEAGGVVSVAGSATIGAQGNLTLNAGTLDVAHTLTIEPGGTATVNGSTFDSGGLILQETGKLNFVGAPGRYVLGNATDNTALNLAGTLGVGPANLSLIDADGVDLGSSTTLTGGTLASSTGFALDGDDEISGRGRLFGDMNLGTNGTIAGSGAGLELFGHVSGTGSISDTTIYGNIDVGNSVGQLTLTDVVLGSDNTVVTLEIGGADSSLYDTITFAGDTTLAGDLEVELIDSFLPQVGDTFSLFSLEPEVALQGDFNDILLPDLETGLWDSSGLLSSGNLLVISTIPNPCSWGGDASCNTADLDALYTVFNTSVPPTDALFDLNADNVVGEADLTEWLSLAATANGYNSPYLRGDTDLDHDVDTVDLTGMIMHYTGATGSGTTWLTGDTDTVDLTTAIINFTGARNAAAAVPEPSSLLLLVLAAGCLAATRGSGCRS